jgi:hypothetical protein
MLESVNLFGADSFEGDLKFDKANVKRLYGESGNG